MNVLTLDMAVASARNLVGKWGEDFTYIPFGDVYSYNSNGDNPTGCLVGEILKDNGLLTDEIALATSNIYALMNAGYVNVDSDETRFFLGHLQMLQDSGRSWSYALNSSLATIGEM